LVSIKIYCNTTFFLFLMPGIKKGWWWGCWWL
jgi:hypothetical protein